MLYVQDCPHYRETLALVDRVRDELGIARCGTEAARGQPVRWAAAGWRQVTTNAEDGG